MKTINSQIENTTSNSNKVQNTSTFKSLSTPYRNRRKNNLRYFKSKMFMVLICLSLIAINNNSIAQYDHHKSDSDLLENSLLENGDFNTSSDLTYSLSNTTSVSASAMKLRMGITERTYAGICYTPAPLFGGRKGFLGLKLSVTL
ncbi:MAG: hypothetical protein QNK23_15365 [Crocinitomicaceae bacterium]|nr:hypothetical protein [Crocinitomicaceae bacterium]